MGLSLAQGGVGGGAGTQWQSWQSQRELAC